MKSIKNLSNVTICAKCVTRPCNHPEKYAPTIVIDLKKVESLLQDNIKELEKVPNSESYRLNWVEKMPDDIESNCSGVVDRSQREAIVNFCRFLLKGDYINGRNCGQKM